MANMAESPKNGVSGEDIGHEKLDSKLKEMFLKEWDLGEDELTDQEILLAIRLGHL